MTTQELYNKVLAEEVTQQKFLYEVRRDTNLPFITSSNNFKDTVKILKNKGIISEKKLSTGKQEVEIYAKTIDMVNPYEYTRGMNYELDVVVDAMGNRISDNAGDSMHIEDLTKDDVLKAQKKVLKNLTKNPQFYQQLLIPQMEGETEHAIEVTAKSIEDLKKKAGKIIREHGEDYEAVSKVMGNVSPLEEDEKSQAFTLALDMFKNAKGTADERKAREALEKASKNAGIPIDLDEQLFDDSEIQTNLQAMSFGERRAELQKAILKWRDSKRGSKEFASAKEYLVKVANALDIKIDPDDLMEDNIKINKDQMAKLHNKGNLKVDDTNIKFVKEYGTGISKEEQIAAKEVAAKREQIYKKYAEEYNVDVNEIKDRLEAYKSKKEQITYNVEKPEDAKKVDAEPGDTVNVGMDM
jgi:hypothetical protein|tara:strand:+ start:266 stop:1501 length:1236 start_codon:yes stop_codon:yes gene_type:complete